MDLLISDTCILIDLHKCDLLLKMNELPYNLGVPDAVVFGIGVEETELITPNSKQVLSAGFGAYSLESNEMIKVYEFNQKYTQPSLIDIFGLVVAKKNKAILLTGDGNLRKAAAREKVEVRGTLWILDTMIEYNIIETKTAAVSLHKIIDKGSYLPKTECDKRFEKWNNGMK